MTTETSTIHHLTSRIEYSHGEFYYYEEGMTPHVCQAIEAIDAERQAITEDVPIGLTIYSQLGRQLSVAVPLMDSVIHLSGALLGRDFVGEGRTLQRCGIDGLSRNQLLAYTDTGARPQR